MLKSQDPGQFGRTTTHILDCFVLKVLVRLPKEVDLFGVEEYWIVTFCKLKQFSS